MAISYFMKKCAPERGPMQQFKTRVFFTAFFIGFYALSFQFLYSRLIFYFIINSEYATAAVISLHLVGFLAGSLCERRWLGNLKSILLGALVVSIASYGVNFKLSADVLPVPVLLVSIVLLAFLTAFFSGLAVIRLGKQQADSHQTIQVVIADTIGSAIAACITGFLFLPLLGIHASFFIGIIVQLAALWLAAMPEKQIHTRYAFGIIIGALLIAVFIFAPFKTTFLRAKGLPLPYMQGGARVLASETTKYGILSIVDTGPKDENAGSRILMLNAMPLCGSAKLPGVSIEKRSEWEVGRIPMINLNKKNNQRIAVIGLGCGVTLASVLKYANTDAQIDVIEINPEMPKFSAYFDPWTKNPLKDSRVNLMITDGFNYFRTRQNDPQAVPYDVVILDVAWMQNANVTHLFSQEMFRFIQSSMNKDGMFGLWSEEMDPFSDTSKVLYITLRSVFPNVFMQHYANNDVVLFYTSISVAQDRLEGLNETDAVLKDYINITSAGYNINTLDTLVMNRAKYGWDKYSKNLAYEWR